VAEMIYNLRDAVLKMKDGSTFNITVPIDEGDLAFSENREVLPLYDRGSIDVLREGNEQLVDVSFTIKYSGLISVSGDVTPYELLKKYNRASSAVSVYSDSEVYAVDVTLEVDSRLILLSAFFPEKIDFKEGEEYNTLAVSGKAITVSES
jgi:hypothetical protein